MIASYPLIPFIFKTQGIGMKVNPRRFEYLKIMATSLSKMETNDFLSVSVNDNLTLESVLLLLRDEDLIRGAI